MNSFIDRMLGRTGIKGSGLKAKERLQFILVHDRINLPPERLEAMKQEILQVISKYVSIDNKNVDIALQKRDRASLIVAEIPFSKAMEDIETDDPLYGMPPDEPSVELIIQDIGDFEEETEEDTGANPT